MLLGKTRCNAGFVHKMGASYSPVMERNLNTDLASFHEAWNGPVSTTNKTHHSQWGRNLSPDCWTPVDFIICLSIFLRNVWRGGCQDSKHFMRRSAALCEGTCNMGWGCCKPHIASWTTQTDIFYNTALLNWIKTSLHIRIYTHTHTHKYI